jgi:hypothetical protein
LWPNICSSGLIFLAGLNPSRVACAQQAVRRSKWYVSNVTKGGGIGTYTSLYFTIFAPFLQNCLTSGLCYQCKIFSVAIFVLCSNKGLAALAVQHKIKQPPHSTRRVENKAKTRVWEELSLCPEISTNGVREFHLLVHILGPDITPV